MIIRFSVSPLSLAHARRLIPKTNFLFFIRQTLTNVRTILVAKVPCVPTSQAAMNALVHRGSQGTQLLEQAVLTSMNALLIPLDLIMWIITMLSLLAFAEVSPNVSTLLAVSFASVQLDSRVTHESRVSVSHRSLFSLDSFLSDKASLVSFNLHCIQISLYSPLSSGVITHPSHTGRGEWRTE